MESPLNKSDLDSDGQALAKERRASARISCDLDTRCQPITGARANSWPGRVVDISVGGLALVLERRFEPGAMLSVRLACSDEESARTLFLRVVHISPHADGSWRLGCAFASELAEEELRAFQAKRLRPTEPDCRAWVRFECNVETECRAVAPAQPGTWPARVLEVSPGGMSLLAPVQFERGTVLNVKLPGGGALLPRHALVRVLRDRSFSSDEWIINGEFTDQLSDEDLQRFQ
jgi:hypothetical protein